MALRLWTLLSATSAAFGLVVRPSLTPSSRAAASRTAPPALGLFDAFSKAFENKDYSNSPAQYEQTNARASHILVSTEAEAQKIKDDLAAGTVTFDEAALQYSSCASSQQGGRLGKFYPGAMAKEFDDLVFAMEDTGEIDLGTGAYKYEPKNALDVVHGPLRTKFGYHLVTITARYMADFDFRAKESL